MPETLAQMAHQALGELATVVGAMPAGAADPMLDAILAAKSIAIHGLGREGLQMRGLAMRLAHLGLDAHVVGDMTTPPLGEGDLLVVSAGPGDFATINALM
jgi:6-phospho-3-hexuloisomerase